MIKEKCKGGYISQWICNISVLIIGCHILHMTNIIHTTVDIQNQDNKELKVRGQRISCASLVHSLAAGHVTTSVEHHPTGQGKGSRDEV